MILQGNAQIGTLQKPMLGVHIAGERINRGGAMEVHKLLCRIGSFQTSGWRTSFGPPNASGGCRTKI